MSCYERIEQKCGAKENIVDQRHYICFWCFQLFNLLSTSFLSLSFSPLPPALFPSMDSEQIAPVLAAWRYKLFSTFSWAGELILHMVKECSEAGINGQLGRKWVGKWGDRRGGVVIDVKLKLQNCIYLLYVKVLSSM